jgi:hypothetical protein
VTCDDLRLHTRVSREGLRVEGDRPTLVLLVQM